MDTPWIFLSHSGKQKEFTSRLYHELRAVGHHPFFDQDASRSLPKAHPYPVRIVHACRSCKVGIVVLSHEYMESLWPMLELEQLCFHNPSILIYPLFYQLQPADLSKKENLSRWQSRWDRKASKWPRRVLQATAYDPYLQFTINMSSWPKALDRLKIQNGDVLSPHMDDQVFIDRIVSNICKTLPPPQHYLLGDHLKGGERMQQDIDKIFKKLSMEANGASMLGVYGVGGSGKTTLCKNMVNFHGRYFPGRCFWLEFPTEEDQNQLTETIKKVLPALAQTVDKDLKEIYTLEEAMRHFAEGLKRHQVFLALDNVWHWALENARQIVEMKYVSGSRVMLTGRFKQVLQKLVRDQIVHVPSITEQEAAEALRCYSFSHVIPEDDLRDLVQSCFFENRCHPLLLKAIGARLREVGHHMNCAEDWKDFISHMQQAGDDNMEAFVLKVLETSFLSLHLKLRDIFVNLVTCTPRRCFFFLEVCEWLSMLHPGYTRERMKFELLKLEYHGLLEIKQHKDDIFCNEPYKNVEETKYVSIHDLHKNVAQCHLSPGAAYSYKFEADKVSLKLAVEKTHLKYLWGSPSNLISKSMKLADFWSKLEVFDLSLSAFQHLDLQSISVEGMKSLRHFKFSGCSAFKKIMGWEGAPNLVSIELGSCPHLQKIGNIECLHKLQKLRISSMLRLQTVPDIRACHELKTLVLCGIDSLKDLGSIGQPMQQIQELDLSDNLNLVDVGALGNFTALQKLKLHGCVNIKKFPNINLSSLRTLNLTNCMKLESMEGSVCTLTSLREIYLGSCVKLTKIPDLKNLAGLKILRAYGCRSLKELKLGICSLSSLEELNLIACSDSLFISYNHELTTGTMIKAEELIPVGSSFQERLRNTSAPEIVLTRYLSTAAASEPLSAFQNLRELGLQFNSPNVASLDVSALARLEVLSLHGFEHLKSITGLGALLSLRCLELQRCLRLDELGDVCVLHKLVKLEIRHSWSLASLPDLKDLTSLESLLLIDCPKLQVIRGIDALINLKQLILDCSMLQCLPDLSLFPNLRKFYLRGIEGYGESQIRC